MLAGKSTPTYAFISVMEEYTEPQRQGKLLSLLVMLITHLQITLLYPLRFILLLHLHDSLVGPMQINHYLLTSHTVASSALVLFP